MATSCSQIAASINPPDQTPEQHLSWWINKGVDLLAWCRRLGTGRAPVRRPWWRGGYGRPLYRNATGSRKQERPSNKQASSKKNRKNTRCSYTGVQRQEGGDFDVFLALAHGEPAGQAAAVMPYLKCLRTPSVLKQSP